MDLSKEKYFSTQSKIIAVVSTLVFVKIPLLFHLRRFFLDRYIRSAKIAHKMRINKVIKFVKKYSIQ